MNIRTVTLEFLRAGPRHNQLLSPLTQYLAVCGDSPAGVVNLPYEHAVFERRRDELRYAVSSDTDPDRLRGVLDQTGSEMAGILASVPGLPGALTVRNEPSELLNLRLVISASELALLPFELSKIPVGGGAAPDNWLQLQGNAPVCLTRHNRAVRSDGVKWTARPRILFVCGPDVPFEEHHQALLDALEPWTGEGQPVENWLTVLQEATREDIYEATRGTDFTHVHILAHGAPDVGSAFGVNLKNSVSSGQQLASALFDLNDKRSHRPTVVTLATCDSAAEGLDVSVPDVSVAHELHAAGIPLVVASQFPLSTAGSVPFVNMFYSDQLRGVHPVLSLYRVRLMLHALNASRVHDWASLVIYEALPPNLNDQLFEVCYAQSRAALEQRLVRMEKAADGSAALPNADEYARLVAAVLKAHGALPDNGPYASECVGLRAASWKRLAQVDYKLAKSSTGTECEDHAESCYLNLQKAVADYRAAANAFLVNSDEPVRRKATLHWLLGQVLSLDAVLGEPFNPDYWTMARFSAEADLDRPQADGVIWGHGTMAELKLLRLTDGSLTDVQAAEFSKEVLEEASKLVGQNGLVSEPVSSTRRQFERYINWWSQNDFAEMMQPFEVPAKDSWNGGNKLIDTAIRALKIMGSGRVRDRRRRVPPPVTPPAAPADSGAKPVDEPEVLGPRFTRSATGIFNIELLPANNGDCLWIEYGDAKAPSRILIDCGAESAAKLLNARVAGINSFELFVLTHIDADHISGVLPFFKNRGSLTFGEVWFNAEPQLPPAVLGVMQGEKFACVLDSEDGLRAAWNKSAGLGEKAPKAIMVPDEGSLPSYTLPGGMRLTVLSPGIDQLKDLAAVWQKELRRFREGEGHKMLSAKARPEPVTDPATLDVEALAKLKEKPDPSVANGSSIALLAEFDGRAVLLTGDAHAEVMAASIKRLLAERGATGRLRLDAMKLSHHGSTNALTKGLLDLIQCPQYLVSTDGSKFYHPDRDAIARVIRYGGQNPKLTFNYKSEMNGFWGEPVLRGKYGYQTEYPDGAPGKRVSL
jgi:hypothetical protein